jgi:Family of unknown function (DUF6073)
VEAIKLATETLGLVESPKSLSELQLFTMPRGGVDRLRFVTWDTIEVLGQGEDTIELRGHYVIERDDPTSTDWRDASVDISMRELSVAGVSNKFGRVHASVNYDIGKESGGQVRAGTAYPEIEDSPIIDTPKLCTMLGHMKFELPDASVTVFNKEPIVLQHKITHIPPIGQGGGTLGRVEVNLYPVDNPDGPPVAILREVKTDIGPWLE